ncbi:hypothetical protein MUK42_17770, partial [Musa troglodytarum]
MAYPVALRPESFLCFSPVRSKRNARSPRFSMASTIRSSSATKVETPKKPFTPHEERATFISHGNTARLAKEHGDLKLAQICGIIASDEKRHETAYTKIVEKLFEIDPDDTVIAFADMMKKKISMPAHLMYDGRDDNLFEHFSVVAQRLGVYTAKDYADILEFLVTRWKVGDLAGLSEKGNKSRDFICNLAPRIRRLEERAHGRAKKAPTIPFSWIFDRE